MPGQRLRRLLWFTGLWLVGVLTLAILTTLLRFLMIMTST